MFDFLKRDKYCGIDWVNVKPIELDDYYVHQVDEKGNTPLYYAALYCEDIWVFERLIDLGADIHEKPVPDSIAKDIELVKLFLKHKAKFSLSILECYCPYKSFELLIDSGVAANATPEELDTILEVKKGSLVLLHGRLPHYSSENKSNKSRHAYTIHIIDGKSTYPNLPSSCPLRIHLI